MKTKKITSGACIALLLCLLMATLFGITSTSPNAAKGSMPAAPIVASLATGNVASGMPVFGNSQVVVTGTNALCLSGTAATSIPCNNVLIYASTTGCCIGSGAATTSCTFPLTTGLQSLPFPITNVNQAYLYASSGTVTVNACYAQ